MNSVFMLMFLGLHGFVNGDWKQDILDKHNDLRATVSPCSTDMQTMVWNNDLENLAASYASQCKWAHSSQSDRQNVGGFSYVGENLAVQTSSQSFQEGNFAVGQAQSWWDEYADYTYDTKYCTPGTMCGHYTQMAWANSNNVGCAYVSCGDMPGLSFSCSQYGHCEYLVCNYGPGGNYNGQHPYQTDGSSGTGACGGTPATDAPTDAPVVVGPTGAPTTGAPTAPTAAPTAAPTGAPTAPTDAPVDLPCMSTWSDVACQPIESIANGYFVNQFGAEYDCFGYSGRLYCFDGTVNENDQYMLKPCSADSCPTNYDPTAPQGVKEGEEPSSITKPVVPVLPSLHFEDDMSTAAVAQSMSVIASILLAIMSTAVSLF